MPYKDGIFTIGNYENGQVKHPLYGFGLLQNVEVFENRGIAKLKNRAVADSTISPDQLPIAEVYDESGNTYTLSGITGVGKVYKNGVQIADAGTMANPWDLLIEQNYLWVSYSSVVSCYGPLDSLNADWFGNVASGFETVYYGKLMTGQDGYIYRTNGNALAKLDITASGVVGVAPTVDTTAEALNLKDGQYSVTLEEFGTKIHTGTHGGINFYDKENHAIARLYPWNRQEGTLGNPGLADLPVIFNENGINATITHANRLFLSAGTQGNIYESDGTNYKKIATLPYIRTGILSRSMVYPNAMDISARGTLLVGLSTFDDDAKGGIYEIDITVAPDEVTGEYPVSFRTISTQATGSSSAPLRIGFLSSKNYQTLKIGWGSGSTYGVDSTDFRMYADYGGVIESPMERVGTALNKKTFEHIEWSLAEPLVEGQNIRISYRTNSNEDYTLIGTWGYEAGTEIQEVGSVMSFEDTAAIADAEFLQIKIEMDQDEATAYGSNINHITTRLW